MFDALQAKMSENALKEFLRKTIKIIYEINSSMFCLSARVVTNRKKQLNKI
jgi:hypothetical protein